MMCLNLSVCVRLPSYRPASSQDVAVSEMKWTQLGPRTERWYGQQLEKAF